MANDDHVICATRTQRSREAVHDGCRREEAKVHHIRRERGGRSCHGRQPNHADLEGTAHDQRIVAYPRHVAPVGIANVRTEDGVVGVAHAGAQRVLRPVEFMVSQCARRETQVVEDLHDRTAEGQVGCRRTLEFIPTIQQDGLARGRHAARGRLMDGGGQVRCAPAALAAVVQTRLERAVKVVGGNDAQVRGGLRAPGRSRSGGRHGAHRMRVIAIVAVQLRVQRCHRARWLDVPVV